MLNYEETIPNPKNLIHSLRDIGYTLDTALADIIDNSISAFASQIDINISFDSEESSIAIIDNGKGMSEEELKIAMTLGSFDPLLKRAQGDLGRFGLGLKTASFSQAERLTVISKNNGSISGRCWDLKHVADKGRWLVGVLDQKDVLNNPHLGSLAKGSGTIVLWEGLDRLIEKKRKSKSADLFYEKISDAREHLALTFHRYLSGDVPSRNLTIRINGDVVSPFNPFETPSNSTLFPEEKVGDVKIQAYQLPHHSKVSAEDYKRLEGCDGYMKMQGFYVYRNYRLLIHGTWFKMAKQLETTKLSRVRIDIPNTADFSWSIDVKKSHARPPEAVRIALKRIIDQIMSSSKRVYNPSGRARIKKINVQVWTESHSHNQKCFSINEDHPIVKDTFNGLSSVSKRKVKSLLTLIEKYLPLDSIYYSMSEDPDSISNDVSDDTLKDYAEQYWEMEKSMGSSFDEIKVKFVGLEPFCSSQEFCKQFIATKGNS